jgi:DMSO/TMAO reductase YedYZ heme-binding membrane subunit
MAQILLFTVVAIGLYFLADWVVRLIESRRGEPLPNRSLIYFLVIFALAVTSFEIIQRILQGAPLF